MMSYLWGGVVELAKLFPNRKLNSTRKKNCQGNDYPHFCVSDTCDFFVINHSTSTSLIQ